MGIESDQLVYDYLSRVGDLAQQRQFPASERMRLVSGLRDEIDRRRATRGEESPAAVRGILGSLGTPDEVVDRAGDRPRPGPGVPAPREGERREPRGGAGPDADSPTGPRTGIRQGPGQGSGQGPGEGPPRETRTGPRKGGASGRGRGEVPGARAGRGTGWLPGRRRPRDGSGALADGAGTSVDARRPAGRVGPPAAPVSGAPGGGSAAPSPGSGSGGAGSDAGADWWRDAEAVDAAAGLPGFFGGVERPDLFKEPLPEDEDEDEDGDGDEEDREDGEDGDEEGRAGAGHGGPGAAVPVRRRLVRVLRRRKPEAPAAPEPEAEPEVPAARFRLSNPFVLLAALLLLGGALFGSLLALAAGWLLAYASRRLTPGEAKTAVLVIPGLAAASGVLWLWGRVDGRWGAPVTAGGEAMGAAVSETWPWVLRGAAVASALFLLWRSRRR
ncbi:hypothetical protein ACIQHY_09685 [Streptomyces sp. NPDC092359]|uniref:hypothetical protein n=1 Tax=Streptomyces sp. NPDC092359 TaxID=3366014 RepID=UPI003804ACA1